MNFSEMPLSDLFKLKDEIEVEIRSRVESELKALEFCRKVLSGVVSVDEGSLVATEVKPQPVLRIPKYKDPATGKTWSGKGKRPLWFDPERASDFLVVQDEVSESPEALGLDA